MNDFNKCKTNSIPLNNSLLVLFLGIVLAFHLEAQTIENNESRENKTEPKIDIKAIELYKNAKKDFLTDKMKACLKMTELSKQSEVNSTIQNLALFKSYIYCENIDNLNPIPSEILEKNPWLEPLNFEKKFHLAEVSKNSNQLSEIYQEKAQRSSNRREKLELLQKALEHSTNPEDKNVTEEIQQKIYKVAPRLEPNPSRENWLRAGQDFITARDFAKGRAYFQKIIKTSGFTNEEKYVSFRQYRNSFKIEQKTAEFKKASQQLINWLMPSKNYHRIHEAFLTLARTQWTDGKIIEAKKTLSLAEKKLTKHFPLDEIYFIRGRMADENEKFEEAIELFKRAARESKDKPTLKEKILFAIAWDLRKLKKYEEAALQLVDLQKVAQDPFAKNRYSFWEAESWRQANQTEAGMALFKKLILDDPIGYYGILSYKKLDQSFPPLKHLDKNPNSLGNFNIQAPNTFTKVEVEKQMLIKTLVLADEPELLSKYISKEIPSLKYLDTESILFILTNQAEAGLYQSLFTNFSNLDPQVRNGILALNPELYFPKKYFETIAPQAKKFNIQPELILSIIRQESSFDPMARSPMDALGLMQVMPTVAKIQEKLAAVQLYHHEDLFKPEINIPLGTSLLSHLMKKYNGQLLLTAAAYNASEKAIANWLKTRYKGNPIEFIEDIPYEETRSYMKLILRNFVFYTRMSQIDQSFKFPEECLMGFDLNKSPTVKRVATDTPQTVSK